MESRAKLFGHPIHQMLIAFPLGVLGASIIFDFIYIATRHGRWGDVAYAMIAFGVLGGLLAAVFGLIDYLAIPKGTRAWSIGFLHGAGNVVVLALFAVSWWLRRSVPAHPPMMAIALSFVGVCLAGSTAWLGGELVDRLGVGVDDGANLNAPSSLTHAHVGDRRTGGMSPRV